MDSHLELNNKYTYKKHKQNRIIVHQNDRALLIDSDSIIRCEAKDNSTIIYLRENKQLKVERKLNQIEESLSDFFFIRVHSNHLLNLNHVNKVPEDSNDLIELSNGDLIPITNKKKSLIINLINRYYNF